jgi:DNA-binding response OmpR family regulator
MIKVLIADDEPSILLSLEFLFKKQGYKVFIARDGDEAIQLFDQENPDVLILDIMMPEVDGYEVCKYAKEKFKDKEPKVVFLTAKNKEGDMEEGFKYRADLYLLKPFSPKELLKQVKGLLA